MITMPMIYVDDELKGLLEQAQHRIKQETVIKRPSFSDAIRQLIREGQKN